jgi:hypothetical protein
MKYLQIPTDVCVTIVRYFAENTYKYAITSPPRIAASLPSHRHRIAATHRRCIASLHEMQATCRLH